MLGVAAIFAIRISYFKHTAPRLKEPLEFIAIVGTVIS